MTNTPYPKRLIEVDLPIKEISAHARREKSIRHGHISTLHIWWARRPLAACRAVLCAALWPDPVDDNCPQPFRDAAARVLCDFAKKVRADADLAGLCSAHWTRWNRTNPHSMKGQDPACWPDMRYALLDFIADFANWDASTVPAFLETARALTQAEHEALGGLPGTRPLVVDPFAGGGAIPLEALRIGADAFASDLNPVAVLLNKVVLEYIPRYGQRLADEVRKWGQWIKEEAEKELAEFYPRDEDGATPIAYLWARTITCEGPGCGAEVPLIRSLWLAKRGQGGVAMRLVTEGQSSPPPPPPLRKAERGGEEPRGAQDPLPSPQGGEGRGQGERRGGKINVEIFSPTRPADVGEGTVRRGSATCSVCGYTTPVTSVRTQLKERRGGAADARLFAVVTTRPGQQGRFYRLPTERDLETVRRAAAELERRKIAHQGPLSLVPDEPTPMGGGSGAGRAFSQRNYGMDRFENLFTPRQALALTTLVRLVREAGERICAEHGSELATAVQSILSCALDREAEHSSSLCRWNSTGEKMQATFGRQALPILWDYCETNPFGGSVGSWANIMQVVLIPFETTLSIDHSGQVENSSATVHPLPDDSTNCFFTDPPYYDAVPYADLSDFFYVWLRRTLGDIQPLTFAAPLTPKTDECIVDEVKGKDRTYFERMMAQTMAEGRRILVPSGVGLVVFAHKTTSGWEAQLQAMVDAGWIITGSWPIDTEMGSRLRAMNSAALASSVHIVCRPRETSAGEVDQSAIGDWRDVLAELPQRIHEWMPRLAEAGVVGADAIFACLGPALEVYSRYSRVERASGEVVTLREYLEQVWAAVAREALTMIFAGADASGFEEDARLTAMWLWTLSAGADGNGGPAGAAGVADENETSGKPAKKGGYYLEYDAARKIAQGLGAHLERLRAIVEVKGDQARLLPVAERSPALFGQEGPAPPQRRKAATQMSLFDDAEATADERGGGEQLGVPAHGATVLDRVHQAMLLFAAGRGEALRRFLVDEGIGQEARVWRLAQALSALYPARSDEKRWVDGVLARKKGLGF